MSTVFLTDKFVLPAAFVRSKANPDVRTTERAETLTAAAARALLSGAFVYIARDDDAATILGKALGVDVQRALAEPSPGDIIVVGQIAKGAVVRWVRATFESTGGEGGPEGET